MPDLSDRIGDDRLREILAGCEGVTPGPWTACHEGDCSCGYIFGDGGEAYILKALTIADEVDPVSTEEQAKRNAKFIVRLDPATVAALCNMALRTSGAEAKIAEQAEAGAIWNDDMRSAPKMTPVLVRLGKKAVGQRDGMHGAVQVAANRGRGWISIPGMWSCDPVAWCRIPDDRAALAEIGSGK